MAAQSSLYNEDRNLLRIKEQERRNHEAVQERCPFQDQAPLFPEPYKRSRGDELSSRIQSMLGNYEEVKEFISAERNQSFIGIPKSAVPVSSQGRPDRLNASHGGAHRPVGPSDSSVVSSGQRHRHHPEPATRPLGKSSAQGSLESTREGQPGNKPMDKLGRRVKEVSIDQLDSPSSISALSPLLSSLSPPGEPLSPLHSSHDVDSKPQGSRGLEKAYGPARSSPSPSDAGRKDGPACVANLIAPAQGFPTSLTSKTNVMPQKPTAYVRPMDGLDQAPNQSPDLKPLQEDYEGESFGTFADLKGKGEKYSKLGRHAEPRETFTNEARCVEDILKEMTHSWPPPLTAIHTPSAGEPTKFPFPTKESQQVPSVKVNQKQYDDSSKVLPSPQEGTSMLEDDLHISESDDSDEEEVSEKPPSSSASSCLLQSQVDSVVSAHSGSVNSDSGESDSSSDSDSEGSSSDGELKVPSRPPSPEPDPPTTNIWQLQNWLKAPASTENHSNDDHEPQGQWLDTKGQESPSPPPHDSPQTIEPHPKKAAWASQEETQNKMAHPSSPPPREASAPRQTVGIKQPRKPAKAFLQEEPKGGHAGLTVESEPAPYRPRDQPSKEKPTVKTKGKTKSGDCKEPKASAAHVAEKKHKSSHGSSRKDLNHQADKKHSDFYKQEPSSGSKEKSQSKANHHRTSGPHPAVVVREDFHRDKVLLPIGDNRLLAPPARSTHRPQSLIVKIDLTMLLRVPGKLSQSKGPKEARQESRSRKKDGAEKKAGQNRSREHSKRKQAEDRGKNEALKKIKVDAGKKSSSSHKELKVPKTSSEGLHKEHRQPKQMSPTQHLLKKAEKVAHKRRPSESSACSHQSAASTGKSNHKDPSSSKHRKVEEKESKHVKNCKGSAENNANPFPVPSLPNGNAKLTRPPLKFEEKLHSPEHYMKEAKKLKHKADAMSDKIGKAFNYLDAAMFFIECGIAMESDVQAPKSAYTMFAETIDLIKFIMKLKNFADSSAPLYEKTFAILCMRCQSLLYMAMFRYKKETAVKYSRTLGEHFKSSCRAAQAPSPCIARMSGTPSPMSPTPSPASSGGSQPGSIASNSGGQSSSVTIPQMIHQIASSYVNITSYFLYAYDIWEQADLLSKKNREFFTDLGAAVCPLALNSTMNELVHYTRQGLHWLRLEASVVSDGAGGHIQAP